MLYSVSADKAPDMNGSTPTILCFVILVRSESVRQICKDRSQRWHEDCQENGWQKHLDYISKNQLNLILGLGGGADYSRSLRDKS